MKKVTLVIFALIIFFNDYSYKKVYAKTKNNLKNTTDLEYRDHIYNPNIKTVNLYSDKNIRSKIEPPAINITSPNQLILEFDELYEDARYFQAKIIHLKMSKVFLSLIKQIKRSEKCSLVLVR